MIMHGYGAVVLAGGAGRRLGGVSKPTLQVGGRSLLQRVLGAVSDARPRVVVGPTELSGSLPPDVLFTREEPAGAGPVAAAAAGLALLPPGTGSVALLAADLPFLTRAAVLDLRRAAAAPTLQGALFIDGSGRRQLLCGVWRVSALASRLAALRAERGRLDGLALRDLLDNLRAGQIPATRSAGGLAPGAEATPPPWFDCDTEADLASAERWADEQPG